MRHILKVFLMLVYMFSLAVLLHQSVHAFPTQQVNAKLKRYVHPTGKCAGASEQMATMYGNGDGHLGKRVSCGGVLDAHRPTVAHRTLPCGAKLQLTNPRNGKSVVATVTDRGPFTIATLDLGPAAYRALGMNTSIYLCVGRL